MKKLISILLASVLIFSAFPGIALADGSDEKELYFLVTDPCGAGYGEFEYLIDGASQRHGFAIGSIDNGIYIEEVLRAEDIEILDMAGNAASPLIFDSFDGKYYSITPPADVDVLDKYIIRYAGQKDYNLIINDTPLNFFYSEEMAEKLTSEVENIQVDISVSAKSKYNLIEWDKDYAGSVDGYSVLRSTSKNGKYKEIYKINNPDVFQCKDSYELKKGTTYYYKVRAYKNIDKKTAATGPDSDIQSAESKKTTTVTKSTIKKNPEYYGLHEDFAKPSSLKTTKQYRNYILYNFLTCNYSMKKGFSTETAARKYGNKICSLIEPLAQSYTDLMGGWLNSDVRYKIKKSNGKYYCSFYSKGAIYSNSTLYSQQVKGLREALHIVDQLHQSRNITDDMTDLEKANYYYNYLLANHQTPDTYNGSCELPGECMEQDTVYACLVNHTAYCGGKAATFNLLMHLEGIESESAGCWFKADAGTQAGHVLSKCRLDGKTYYVDWGNEVPIMNPDGFAELFVLY